MGSNVWVGLCIGAKGLPCLRKNFDRKPQEVMIVLSVLIRCFSYLATFEKATTHNEILSALHQAVVEVVTLNDNISLLSNDLFQTTHTQEASAVISSTSIELDNTGKQLVLRYEDGAKEKILDSICGGFAKRFTSPDHMPPTSDGVEVQISETSKDLDGRSNHSSRTGQMRASQAVEEVEGNEQYSRMGEDKPFDGNEESSMDTVSSPPFRRRIPYPVVSLDFLTLPVESPEQRFYVSNSIRASWLC